MILSVAGFRLWGGGIAADHGCQNTKGPKLFEELFLFFLVMFFFFVRLLGLRGQAGGREGGGFFLGKH